MFVDELQADLPDLVKSAAEIVEHLRNAESCDCKEDFCSNLESALASMSSLKSWIKPVLQKAYRCKGFSEARNNE